MCCGADAQGGTDAVVPSANEQGFVPDADVEPCDPRDEKDQKRLTEGVLHMDYAVIDLGSNTIRLCVFNFENGTITTLLRQKEVVGLADYAIKTKRKSILLKTQTL